MEEAVAQDLLDRRHERKQQTLREAERTSEELAGARGETHNFGESGRLTRQVPLEAFMNAYDQEGPGVITPEAEGYWKDQDRRHPQIQPHKDKATGNGRRNRFGRVTERITFHGDGTKTVKRYD